MDKKICENCVYSLPKDGIEVYCTKCNNTSYESVEYSYCCKDFEYKKEVK